MLLGVDREAIAILLWDVWSYRNLVKFSGSAPNKNALLHRVRLHMEEFGSKDSASPIICRVESQLSHVR